MIRLVNLTKVFHLEGVRKTVLERCNIQFASGRSYGLMGCNGSGKSTLLRMIAGTQNPSSGRIEISGTVSWPVGFAGSFHPDLSGAQNARYVARIYGVDSDELVAFARDFAELGAHFSLPVRSYSSGMISRLAFGLSMGIDFDTYLVDEVTAVGDERFRQKSNRVFLERMRSAGAIVVNHSPAVIRELCDEVMVLHRGRLHHFSDVSEGLRFYNETIFAT